MLNKNSHTKSIILLLITATLWSLAGVFIKWIDWNPMAISGMRSFIAIVVILVFLRKPRLTWSVAQVGGALFYAVAVTTMVIATKLTTAANAILLQYTAPIYVALFSGFFLKERTRSKDWMTIFIVMGGMVLFFMDQLSNKGFLGNLFGIISGIGFAGFAICARMQKNGSSLESVLIGNIITALIGIPFMFGHWPSQSGWIILILLGVIQFAVPYILFTIAIRNVTALESLLIPVIEPILNPVWVFLAIGEAPGKWAFIGGIIVLLSIATRCISSYKTEILDTST